MRKPFFNVCTAVFSISGSIIGAGFITGKEINGFFGEDFSLSGIYLAFLLFAISFFIIMNIAEKGSLVAAVKFVVAICNVFIAACMVAALKSVYGELFNVSENIKLLHIISLIFAFIICFVGVRAIGVFSLASIPFLIAVLIFVSLAYSDGGDINVSPRGSVGVVYPMLYVGINTMLSSGVIQGFGTTLSVKEKIATAAATSLTLCLCIAIVGNAVRGVDGEMPLAELVASNRKLYIIVHILMLFAIFSTLVSSLYSVFSVLPSRYKMSCLTVLFLLVVFLSRFGFSSIVENVYPVIGAVGIVYIAIFSSLFFRRVRRERTLPLRERKV